MSYTFRNRDISLEFTGNLGTATVLASSEADALHRLREVFAHVREESIRHLQNREYLITFKVSYTYRLPLLRTVERVARRIRTRQVFERSRYLDKYLVARLAEMTGKPEWLVHEHLPEEIAALRKAAIVAREAAGILQFVDWDIVLATYAELNSKPGHKSRSIRTHTSVSTNENAQNSLRAKGQTTRRLRRANRQAPSQHR